MSVKGLGCVKTLYGKYRGVAIVAEWRYGPFFGPDYVLIAAMSGWIPMMFITRVRL
jgi:hypothetical protein